MHSYAPHGDSHRYINYYNHQAGSGIDGYQGLASQYGGFNIASLFKGLYRMAMPLIRRGVSIAKPHLKHAAKAIVGDVIHNAMASRGSNEHQGGSGLAVINPPSFGMHATEYPQLRRRTTRRSKQKKRRVKTSRRSVSRKRRPKRYQVRPRSTKRRRLSIF